MSRFAKGMFVRQAFTYRYCMFSCLVSFILATILMTTLIPVEILLSENWSVRGNLQAIEHRQGESTTRELTCVRRIRQHSNVFIIPAAGDHISLSISSSPSCTMPVSVGGHVSPSISINRIVDQLSITVSTMPHGQAIQNTTTGQQVILMTYGRSGSSLTSEVIRQQKEVYMYFEPLHNLAKLYTSVQEDYMEETHEYLHLTSIPEYNEKAVDILERLMTCNYQHLPLTASLNIHMRLYDSAHMFRCMKRANSPEKQATCLREGEAKCKAKSIHFLKVIRLSTTSIGQLMDRHPCLKMIYLVRDPRGNFLSKQRAFNIFTDNTTYEAERFCKRINKDIDHTLKLKRQYPERVLLTRYENLAEQPISTTVKLYQFLNLDFTDSVALYLYNNTRAGFGDRRLYALTRGNSSEVCYAWRSKIKFADVKAFDSQCKDVYHKLGYLPVTSESDLRNQHFPLKIKKSYLT